VEEISLLKFFFRLSIHALAAKIQPDKVVRWCQNGEVLRPVYSASRVQHISDMHSKFALWPHHVWHRSRIRYLSKKIANFNEFSEIKKIVKIRTKIR